MRKETLIGQLRNAGLKATSQRLAIIDALVLHEHLHPGANLIYREARKKMKGLSLSTVYATLNEFSRHGMIKTLEFDKMENRYEGDLSEHINLICRRCGKIADYPSAPTVELEGIARHMGFVVTDSRLDYYGYCRECRDGKRDGKEAIQGRGKRK